MMGNGIVPAVTDTAPTAPMTTVGVLIIALATGVGTMTTVIPVTGLAPVLVPPVAVGTVTPRQPVPVSGLVPITGLVGTPGIRTGPGHLIVRDRVPVTGCLLVGGSEVALAILQPHHPVPLGHRSGRHLLTQLLMHLPLHPMHPPWTHFLPWLQCCLWQKDLLGMTITRPAG